MNSSNIWRARDVAGVPTHGAMWIAPAPLQSAATTEPLHHRRRLIHDSKSLRRPDIVLNGVADRLFRILGGYICLYSVQELAYLLRFHVPD